MSALFGFLTETFFGQSLSAFFISMVPVIELRGALPIATQSFHLNYWYALLLCVVGNLVPVPFLVIFIKKLFAFMRRWQKLDRPVTWFEERGRKKGATIQNCAFWGLFILVAIPLPGTGAWTGALVAAMLDMDLKRAFPAIALGVVGAAVIVSLVTKGVAFAV